MWQDLHLKSSKEKRESSKLFYLNKIASTKWFPELNDSLPPLQPLHCNKTPRKDHA